MSDKTGKASETEFASGGVRLTALRKVFDADPPVTAIDGVSLEVEPGEAVALLGPSGCGKTTLLRCLAGLETPDEGEIELAGNVVFSKRGRTDLPANRRKVGLVFQNYSLWPHMRVARNVRYPLRARGLRELEQRGRVSQVLELVQCEHLIDRYPGELSGGQQQRVALARALAPMPDILLFDEPLSNLDATLRVELRTELRRIQREAGYTAIYVTHDQSEAMEMADRIIVLKAGAVEQVAAPSELYSRPRTEYVATFMGIRNRFSLAREAGGWSLRGLNVQIGDLPGLRDCPGSNASLFVRPEDLRVHAPEFPDEALTGDREVALGEWRVVDVVFGGGYCDLVLTRAEATAHARVPGTAVDRYAVGQDVHLVAPVQSTLIYPESTGVLAEVAPRAVTQQ